MKPHVLRYWEQEFTQLKPVKRRGNRRYYQHHEVLLIRRIRELLYEQGFTISGARNRLDSSSPHEEKAEPAPRSAPRRSTAGSVDLARDQARAARRPGPARRGKIHALRGVAQPGSVPAWGAGGREFKSRRPDQDK